MTAPTSIESNVYVAETNSATSWLGASRMRSPSAVSTMTSAKRPNGDSSHDPTTIRTPEPRAEARDVAGEDRSPFGHQKSVPFSSVST